MLALPGVVAAKEKPIPLTTESGSSMKGKTVALTLHEKPDFIAMTAGKAAFAVFGAAAMATTGNKLIADNNVEDPATIVRTELSTLLGSMYEVSLLPLDKDVTRVQKPKEIAALHPEADYVMDVRSGGWMMAYYPTDWSHYWVGYSVQVQIIDVNEGRLLSNYACNAGTKGQPSPPTREQLLDDGARMLKDVTSSLGWQCTQLLAREQFRADEDQLAQMAARMSGAKSAADTAMSNDSAPASASESDVPTDPADPQPQTH